MRKLKRRWPALLLLLFGSIFLTVGIAVATIGASNATRAAERAEALRPLGAAGLDDTFPGRDALVEGTIDSRTRAQFREFVAYVRYEYQGKDENEDERWVEDVRVTPPLLLATVSGLVTIGGAGYRIEGPAHEWRESDTLTWTGAEGTKRYTGLRAGDAVTAIGTVVDGAEGRELAAEVVFAGTQAEYAAAKRQESAAARLVGGIAALTGTVICAIGGWLVMRR